MEYLLKEIDVFVKVIDLGSFRAAADALSLTQSAITQRLKRLEDALGVRLVERTTRNVSPTAIGREFLPTARRMLLQFEQSMADLNDMIQANTGQVTIASLISVATHVLPQALRAFSKTNPKVAVRIIDDAERTIVSHVRRGDAEFGIDMQTAEPEPGLTLTPLIEDSYVVACRANHPFASRKTVSWMALESMPLITLGARSGTSRLLLSQLPGERLSNAWRYEVQHLSTLMGMVREGVGVGIVPQMVMRADKSNRLIQRRLIDPEVKRNIVLVERQGAELSPAAQKLKEGILRVVSEFNSGGGGGNNK